MRSDIEAAFSHHRELLNRCSIELPDKIAEVAAFLINVLRAGGKIMLCGNGGSAADAQHIAAELTGRYLRDRRALAALALTTDSSVMTSIANDFAYDEIFARQVEGLSRPGDALIAISTSGNSTNVVRAVDAAKHCGVKSVALVGNRGGRLAELCDHAIIVPSAETARIQELHILIGHMLCDQIDMATVDAAVDCRSAALP